ncbi:MAG TPA: prepilin-type N-terminal cleavage/methylation domain-containing protein [Verrucomicrobiae bacterium]|jgi:prepilin-type N-terminal cleavage/methylation domain-containing protein/prepilin-type processing-associated H-X9-DG protein|nr:prepilin-type N-terminal cleavage/methylation domain-containing protein [Verrucomicrobiae bacterium]
MRRAKNFNDGRSTALREWFRRRTRRRARQGHPVVRISDSDRCARFLRSNALSLRRFRLSEGFTLIELLVVIAIIAILAAILMPVLHHAQIRAESAGCMNNARQLMIGWVQYYDDYNDQLVNNYQGPQVALEEQNKTYRSWVNDFLSWGPTDPNVGMPVTNIDGITQAPFFRYVGNIKTYKCPGDHYVSPQQLAQGMSFRPRSYSMSCFFGAYGPNPKANVPAGANDIYPTYRQFMKSSDLRTPAELFVILDEHADSINDGWLQTNPDITSGVWNDLPASYHDGACGIAFADGHSEIHVWKSRTCTILPVLYQNPPDRAPWPQFSTDASGIGWRDGQWLEQRASLPLN